MLTILVDSFYDNYFEIWIDNKVSKSGPVILYLMHVDIYMMFCKANRKASRQVKDIMENYCKASNQLVNFHKFMTQFFKGNEKRN